MHRKKKMSGNDRNEPRKEQAKKLLLEKKNNSPSTQKQFWQHTMKNFSRQLIKQKNSYKQKNS